MGPVKNRKEKLKPEISNGSFVPNIRLDKPGRRCVAYNKDGNWRVFINTKCNMNFSTTECFLWNQLLQLKVELPYLPDAPESFSKCAVTCFTIFPRVRRLGKGICCYRVFFFHKNSPSYVWCSHGDDSWREGTYANDLNSIFHDAIYFDTSSVDDDSLKLCSISILGTFFGLDQDIISPYISLIYKRRLVPYYGEKRDRLFVLVRKPLCVWEVWEIDIEQQSYVSVANLEGVAVFLSWNYSVAYSCPEGNSIWFTEDGDDENFYVFSLLDQSLSIIKTFPGSFPDINDSGRPCFSFTDENQQKNATIEEPEENGIIEEPEENANESMRLYSDKSCGLATIYHEFPLDLKRYIAESLRSVEDYANFRLVCRKWREIARPLRWKPDFSSRASIKSPWLMMFHEKDSCFSFVDPTCNMRYYNNNINELMGCKVRYSKDGWLIITRGKRTIFFFEPFSKTKISLADLPEKFHIDGVCFSSSPQSSDWVVVAILSRWDRLRVMYLRSVDTQWDFVEHEMGVTFFSSGSNPVFHDHKFYYLGRNGSLVAFWWEMFTFKFSIEARDGSIEPLSDYRRGYLVSCEDDLHLVVVGPLGKFINVYKLNVDTSKWNEVEMLEKFSLFISQTSSVALPISERSQQSAINLPLFVEDRHLSCKLGVSEFRCYDGGRELYKRKEFITGTWVQPKVIRGYR